MAETSLERGFLTCPMCLDLLSDPVTIPCGHSFCAKCIGNSWSNAWSRYQCPQCRQTCKSKPILNKNIILANLVELMRKSTPAPDVCAEADSQDVSCDVCTGRKLKAVRSCLQCAVSFCDRHLQPHRDVASLQRHPLVTPCNKLQENICYEHYELKKVFCRTDQLPVCEVCSMQHHEGHNTVSSAEERAQRQAELEATMDLMQNRLLHKEADHQQLLQNSMVSGQSATSAELHCTNTFTELIEILQNIQREVQQHIASQLHMEINQNNNLQDKLNQECSKLKRGISELEELASTKVHNHVLLLYPSAQTSPCAFTNAQPSSSELTVQHTVTSRLRPPLDFDYVVRAVTALREKTLHAFSDFLLPEPEVPVCT